MIMSAMSSFKRKRIETWCEEVAQYLRNGTICRSVIGHVAEDAICGNSVVPTAAENHEQNENRENVISNSADAFLTGKINTNSNNKIDATLRNNPTNPGVVDSNIFTKNGTGSFPYVRFTYNHYHEQRRKIDRLVQGLPVLNSNSVSTMDRPDSKASTEDHVPLIIVNGEEPVRNPRSRSSSLPPRRHAHQHSHAHIIASPNQNTIQINTPHTARQLAHGGGANFRATNRQARPATFDGMRRSGAARVSGDRGQEVTVTVDPALGLSANERLERIKTAPTPNRNVTRARQRILTRRNNNRLLEHTSQIPLQNCWQMAELTW